MRPQSRSQGPPFFGDTCMNFLCFCGKMWKQLGDNFYYFSVFLFKHQRWNKYSPIFNIKIKPFKIENRFLFYFKIIYAHFRGLVVEATGRFSGEQFAKQIVEHGHQEHATRKHNESVTRVFYRLLCYLIVCFIQK